MDNLLEQFKQHLRLPVEYTEEDKYLSNLLTVSENYLFGATGKTFPCSDVELYRPLSEGEVYKEFRLDQIEMAELIIILISSDLYDNRSYTIDSKSERKFSNMYQSIIRQLKYN